MPDQMYVYLSDDILMNEMGILADNMDSNKVSSLDFSDDRYQLRTLNRLELYGAKALDRFRRNGVTHIDVSNNDLTSLLQLCVTADTGEPMFTQAQQIIARRNLLSFLCPTAVNMYQNFWPRTMVALLVLDLRHNQLTEIPLLSSMPNLERLLLSHNYISEGGPGDFTKALSDGLHLKALDLSHNVFKWDLPAYLQEIRVLSTLSALESVDFSLNEFAARVPDYELYLVSVCGSRLNRVGGHAVSWSMREKARRMYRYSDATVAAGAYEAPDTAQRRGGPFAHGSLMDSVESIRNTFYVRQPLMRADFLRVLDKCLHSPTAAATCVLQLKESLEYLFHHPGDAVDFFGAADGDGPNGGGTDTHRTRSEAAHVRPGAFSGEQRHLSGEHGKEQTSLSWTPQAIDECLMKLKLLTERDVKLVPHIADCLAFMSVVRQLNLGSKASQQLVAMHRSGIACFMSAVETAILTKVVPEMSRSFRQDASPDLAGRKVELRRRLTSLVRNIPGLLHSIISHHTRVIEDEVAVFVRRSGDAESQNDTAGFLAAVSDHQEGAQLLGFFQREAIFVTIYNRLSAELGKLVDGPNPQTSYPMAIATLRLLRNLCHFDHPGHHYGPTLRDAAASAAGQTSRPQHQVGAVDSGMCIIASTWTLAVGGSAADKHGLRQFRQDANGRRTPAAGSAGRLSESRRGHSSHGTDTDAQKSGLAGKVPIARLLQDQLLPITSWMIRAVAAQVSLTMADDTTKGDHHQANSRGRLDRRGTGSEGLWNDPRRSAGTAAITVLSLALECLAALLEGSVWNQVPSTDIVAVFMQNPHSVAADFVEQFVRSSDALLSQFLTFSSTSSGAGSGSRRGPRRNNGHVESFSGILSQIFEQLCQPLGQYQGDAVGTSGRGRPDQHLGPSANDSASASAVGAISVSMHADVASAIWRCVHVLCGTIELRARMYVQLVDVAQSFNEPGFTSIGQTAGSIGVGLLKRNGLSAVPDDAETAETTSHRVEDFERLLTLASGFENRFEAFSQAVDAVQTICRDMNLIEHLLKFINIRDSSLFRKIATCTDYLDRSAHTDGSPARGGGAFDVGSSGHSTDGGRNGHATGRTGSKAGNSASSNASLGSNGIGSSIGGISAGPDTRQLAAFHNNAVSSMTVSALFLVGFFCGLLQQTDFRASDNYMRDFNRLLRQFMEDNELPSLLYSPSQAVRLAVIRCFHAFPLASLAEKFALSLAQFLRHISSQRTSSLNAEVAVACIRIFTRLVCVDFEQYLRVGVKGSTFGESRLLVPNHRSGLVGRGIGSTASGTGLHRAQGARATASETGPGTIASVTARVVDPQALQAELSKTSHLVVSTNQELASDVINCVLSVLRSGFNLPPQLYQQLRANSLASLSGWAVSGVRGSPSVTVDGPDPQSVTSARPGTGRYGPPIGSQNSSGGEAKVASKSSPFGHSEWNVLAKTCSDFLLTFSFVEQSVQMSQQCLAAELLARDRVRRSVGSTSGSKQTGGAGLIADSLQNDAGGMMALQKEADNAEKSLRAGTTALQRPRVRQTARQIIVAEAVHEAKLRDIEFSISGSPWAAAARSNVASSSRAVTTGQVPTLLEAVYLGNDVTSLLVCLMHSDQLHSSAGHVSVSAGAWIVATRVLTQIATLLTGVQCDAGVQTLLDIFGQTCSGSAESAGTTPPRSRHSATISPVLELAARLAPVMGYELYAENWQFFQDRMQGYLQAMTACAVPTVASVFSPSSTAQLRADSDNIGKSPFGLVPKSRGIEPWQENDMETETTLSAYWFSPRCCGQGGWPVLGAGVGVLCENFLVSYARANAAGLGTHVSGNDSNQNSSRGGWFAPQLTQKGPARANAAPAEAPDRETTRLHEDHCLALSSAERLAAIFRRQRSERENQHFMFVQAGGLEQVVRLVATNDTLKTTEATGAGDASGVDAALTAPIDVSILTYNTHALPTAVQRFLHSRNAVFSATMPQAGDDAAARRSAVAGTNVSGRALLVRQFLNAGVLDPLREGSSLRAGDVAGPGVDSEDEDAVGWVQSGVDRRPRHIICALGNDQCGPGSSQNSSHFDDPSDASQTSSIPHAQGATHPMRPVLVSSVLRIVLALLRHGPMRFDCVRRLRSRSVLRLLVAACFGSSHSANSLWLYENVGCKLMVVLDEVLCGSIVLGDNVLGSAVAGERLDEKLEVAQLAALAVRRSFDVCKWFLQTQNHMSSALRLLATRAACLCISIIRTVVATVSMSSQQHVVQADTSAATKPLSKTGAKPYASPNATSKLRQTRTKSFMGKLRTLFACTTRKSGTGADVSRRKPMARAAKPGFDAQLEGSTHRVSLREQVLGELLPLATLRAIITTFLNSLHHNLSGTGRHSQRFASDGGRVEGAVRAAVEHQVAFAELVQMLLARFPAAQFMLLQHLFLGMSNFEGGDTVGFYRRNLLNTLLAHARLMSNTRRQLRFLRQLCAQSRFFHPLLIPEPRRSPPGQPDSTKDGSSPNTAHDVSHFDASSHVVLYETSVLAVQQLAGGAVLDPSGPVRRSHSTSSEDADVVGSLNSAGSAASSLVAILTQQHLYVVQTERGHTSDMHAEDEQDMEQGSEASSVGIYKRNVEGIHLDRVIRIVPRQLEQTAFLYVIASRGQGGPTNRDPGETPEGKDTCTTCVRRGTSTRDGRHAPSAQDMVDVRISVDDPSNSAFLASVLPHGDWWAIRFVDNTGLKRFCNELASRAQDSASLQAYRRQFVDRLVFPAPTLNGGPLVEADECLARGLVAAGAVAGQCERLLCLQSAIWLKLRARIGNNVTDAAHTSGEREDFRSGGNQGRSQGHRHPVAVLGVSNKTPLADAFGGDGSEQAFPVKKLSKLATPVWLAVVQLLNSDGTGRGWSLRLLLHNPNAPWAVRPPQNLPMDACDEGRFGGSSTDPPQSDGSVHAWLNAGESLQSFAALQLLRARSDAEMTSSRLRELIDFPNEALFSDAATPSPDAENGAVHGPHLKNALHGNTVPRASDSPLRYLAADGLPALASQQRGNPAAGGSLSASELRTLGRRWRSDGLAFAWASNGASSVTETQAHSRGADTFVCDAFVFASDADLLEVRESVLACDVAV